MLNPTEFRPRAVLALSCGLAAFVAASTAGGQTPTPIAYDSETTIGGVGVACSGIGQSKDQARWLAYSVRIEFADATGLYLADETLTLSDPAGTTLLGVSCKGPWLLLKLPDRRAYRVDAQLAGRSAAPVSATVKSPEHGQARVVLTFPKAE